SNLFLRFHWAPILSLTIAAYTHYPIMPLNSHRLAAITQSSAMWDMMYGPRPLRPGTYGDVSSGSSGY
ncbi:hypothetical protein M9458_041148, partial [Cirrhinus mrigala]